MYYHPGVDAVFKTHSEIRSAFHRVLFPEIIDDEMLAYHGIYPLVWQEPMVEAGQIVVPFQRQLIDGIWTQLWTVRDATEEELAAIEAAQRAKVPQKVWRRQALQALRIRGLLDQVAVAIAALDDETPEGKLRQDLAEIDWQDSLEFLRDHPLVIQIGAAIGLDAAELDELFIEAARL